MLDLLMCPTPFLVGIHKSYAFKLDFPFVTDAIVVDLDQDDVSSASKLPATLERQLLRKIKRALSPELFTADGEFRARTSKHDVQISMDEEIRDAFRQAILNLLAGVHLACFTVDHCGEQITFIDETSWLNSKKPDERPFLIAMLRTQAFSSFIGSIKS
jgi:hypothetical protein